MCRKQALIHIDAETSIIVVETDIALAVERANGIQTNTILAPSGCNHALINIDARRRSIASVTNLTTARKRPDTVGADRKGSATAVRVRNTLVHIGTSDPVPCVSIDTGTTEGAHIITANGLGGAIAFAVGTFIDITA